MTELLVPQLLRHLHTDEYDAVPYDSRLGLAVRSATSQLPAIAHRVSAEAAYFAFDRRATALSLSQLNAAHGEQFYRLQPDSTLDAAAAAASFSGRSPVVDVQTHIVDEAFASSVGYEALAQFNAMVDPERWSDGMHPRMVDAAMWAALVFSASETAVALLTSTPGKPGDSILENAQVAAVREVVDRYAGSGRLLTHTIIHPNFGPAELSMMQEHARTLKPSAWKVYTMYGPPTRSAPEGGWFFDDDEVGLPFLDQVMQCIFAFPVPLDVPSNAQLRGGRGPNSTGLVSTASVTCAR
jgi:hypothetical protein